MRITSKGQVTIPQDIREKLGLLPDTEVDFELNGNKAFLQKRIGRHNKRSRELILKMAGKATVKMSTDEIMKLTRAE